MAVCFVVLLQLHKQSSRGSSLLCYVLGALGLTAVQTEALLEIMGIRDYHTVEFGERVEYVLETLIDASILL